MVVQLPFPEIPPALAVVLAVFSLVGLFAFGYGGRTLLTAYRLRRTAPTPVSDLANVTGRVEVVGTAEPYEGTLAAPFTGTESLVCEWRVEEARPDDDGGTDWERVASGVEWVPFLLADGSASVLVEAGDADRRLATERRIHVPGGDRPPERIRAFIAGNDDVDSEEGRIDLGVVSLATGNGRRYVERRLDPGEDALVYGEPAYAPGLSERVGQVNARFEDGFLLTDADEAGTERRVLYTGLGALAVGTFVLALVALFLHGALTGSLVVG